MATRDGYVGSSGSRLSDGVYDRRLPPVQPARTAREAPGRVTLTAGGALLLLLLVGAAGVAVDLLLGPSVDVGTLVSLAVGAFLAALLVRRQGLFLIMIAPPLAYLALTALALVVSGVGFGVAGLAAGVVFGFPTMAVATLVAVLTAGLRLISGR